MANKSKNEDQLALTNLYGLCIAARDLEINQLVQRNNFFMIFQGVLLAGLIQAAGNGKIIPIVSFLVCCGGIIASLLQIGMAAGAKFWQERWEHAVEEIERLLLNSLYIDGERKMTYEIFSAGNAHIDSIVDERMKGKLIGPLVRIRFSPSRLPIYAGLAFLIIWSLLLASQTTFFPAFSTWLVGFKPVV